MADTAIVDRRVLGPLAADDLDHREHVRRLKEVHRQKAVRDTSAAPASSSSGSPDVFVASAGAPPYARSIASNTDCFTARSSNTASITRSGAEPPGTLACDRHTRIRELDRPRVDHGHADARAGEQARDPLPHDATAHHHHRVTVVSRINRLRDL